ncbi:MAG: LysR family transcriptional regulator [Myxococcota bacterium]
MAVADAGSFTAAAKALDLPTSAVSRRVSRLEETLGERLLHRTTRRVGLTDVGRIFHARVAGIPGQLDEAERALRETRAFPGGLVRLTAPPDDGGLIWQLLEGFVRAHPKVELEVIHTLEYLDLVGEGIDVAIRGGDAPDSTLFTAHALLRSRILLAASPAYLKARGTPASVEELATHDGVGMDGWAPNAIRRLDGSPARVRMKNRVRSNRLDTVQAAVLAGLGIGPLLALNVRQWLADGSLVEVLRGCLPMDSALWAIYPAGRQGTAAAKALVAHLRRTAPLLVPELP